MTLVYHRERYLEARTCEIVDHPEGRRTDIATRYTARILAVFDPRIDDDALVSDLKSFDSS